MCDPCVRWITYEVGYLSMSQYLVGAALLF